MTVAVNVEHLSKRYLLGQAERPTMFREALVNLWSRAGTQRRERGEIWALNDVTFRIDRGEVLGLVGRNGAGKSTLLKVLSRITYPTTGHFAVKGRVASLLEVGTGFHDELTGRENIYFSGSILGMPKSRIDAKLDAIIDFAGVSRFIDTPIKRYSSGMRLRLGFAVAAHLDSDVLLVDEVLAVGDGEFQKKCLQTMDDLHATERTVIFVSHNLAAVEHLCSRAIWIDEGRIRDDGDPKEVIASYMATFGDARRQSVDLRGQTSRRGSGHICFTRIEFLTPDRLSDPVVHSGDTIVTRLHFEAKQRVESPIFSLEIHTQLGTLVAQIHTYNSGVDVPTIEPGAGTMDVEIYDLNLVPGQYTISLFVANLGYMFHDVLQHCATLDIEPSSRYGLGRGVRGNPIVSLRCAWNLCQNGGEQPLRNEIPCAIK
jgi:lipopolysaccharide transport system ATP-binding protein